MKETKRIIAILLIPILLFMQNGVVSAETLSREAVYDLEKGGTQTFLVQDENGEIGEVVICQVDENARMTDGKYKVSYAHKGAWKAGFYLEVDDNKIIKAYSPFYTVYTGEIQQTKLVKESALKAMYSFVYQYGVLKHKTGVVATIVDFKLKVTKK